MNYVMRIVALGDRTMDTFLKSFDFEAHGGLGEAVLTNDIAGAKRFSTKLEVIEFWQTVSTTRPTRRDGRPNRPLTSATISIETDEEEVKL